MSRSIRWLILAGLPLAACNVQISTPHDDYDGGSGNTRLPAPSGLTSISLDGAIQLSWSGSVVVNHPDQFRLYRVYSTRFLSGSGRCDDGGWSLEGTTVSDGFLASNLVNGVTRCFAVSTVAQDGGEGNRSPARADTPRHGGSFVLIDAFDARPSSSGWLFSSGYAFIEAEAVAGDAYVFAIPQVDGVHYGARRVAYTGRDYVVLDWSYQTAPNNAELLRM